MRWKRRRLRWRAFRSRHALRAVIRHRAPKTGVLCFSCVRNEAERLPHFLTHHRALGVSAFFFIDNGSTDGTSQFLAEQPDVSLWRTDHSYKAARFGMDWVNWLLMRYGRGRWCLTLDADELLVYPRCDTDDLSKLIERLEANDQDALGTLMVELYPKGPLGAQEFAPGQNPLEVLTYFDAQGYRSTRQRPMQNLRVQGGVRERVFFEANPELSPTLNKLPLVRWRRGYVYANSTHSMLPPRMNHAYDGPTDQRLTGALLHTKFLPSTPARAIEEANRGQHFHDDSLYQSYYSALAAHPDLWHSEAQRYEGWHDLVASGLMYDPKKG